MYIYSQLFSLKVQLKITKFHEVGTSSHVQVRRISKGSASCGRVESCSQRNLCILLSTPPRKAINPVVDEDPNGHAVFSSRTLPRQRRVIPPRPVSTEQVYLNQTQRRSSCNVRETVRCFISSG